MEIETVPYAPTASNPIAALVARVARLAVFAPNWLGDAVMALPAVADVRRALPKSTIEIVARKSVAPLFSLVPGVDHVITIDDRPRAVAGAVGALRDRRFEAALLLPNSFHSAVVAWRAGIPERWGYRSDWRGVLLTKAIGKTDRVHQAVYHQRLVGELGFPTGPACPQVTVPQNSVESARQLLGSAGWDGTSPLVVLAPGAAYGGAKKWPAQSFAEITTRLAADGYAMVLVGSERDLEAAASVKQHIRMMPIDLVGRTDLPTLAGVLSLSRLVVTNDSGAMHVASAVGVPVVAVFGPTNERETRPLGPREPIVITSKVWCRPCMLRECPIDHRCMERITVDAVVAAARQCL